MNAPFSKFVLPIDKKVFRLHILKCLSFQLLLVTIVYIFLQNREANLEPFQNWGDYYAAWMANLAMLLFVYDLNMFRARFKDIYPDQELNKIFYFFVGFIPVFFAAMVIFLCVKNSDSGNSYPRAFRKRYALLGLLPLLALQGQFPVVSFWTASPTGYYLVNTLHQSEEKAIEEIKQMKSIDEAMKSKPGAVTLLALVWKASLDLQKSEGRTIASFHGTYSDNFKEGFKFLHTCREAISISEDNSIKVTDFSPIHWLHPSGPVEIIESKLLDQSLKERTAFQLHERCFSILERMEDRYEKLQIKNSDYNKEMSDLRMAFYRTRTYTKFNKPDAIW